MGPPPHSDFFLPEPHPTLLQGDIVLAPSSILWSDGVTEVAFRIPQVPPLGETVLVPAWDPHDGTPYVVHETRWSPVIVLSHDCELEKEFNREVRLLMERGASETDAVERASVDPSLDRFVVVSPLLPYDELPEDQRSGIHDGNRIGYFPIPAYPTFDGEEFAVHLSRVSTVERNLLLKYEKLASLTRTAVGVLRYKLSEVFASRDLALLAEIEAMVGRTVLRVDATGKSSKATSLVLYLDDGNSVHLDVRRPREGIVQEITRLVFGRRPP